MKIIWQSIVRTKKNDVNVYFISGMCYNCGVFDKLKLPKGFKKKYIEWHIPRPDESLDEYARVMAGKIDTSHPFVLVGYSFGAVIMQEMDRKARKKHNNLVFQKRRRNSESVPRRKKD